MINVITIDHIKITLENLESFLLGQISVFLITRPNYTIIQKLHQLFCFLGIIFVGYW